MPAYIIAMANIKNPEKYQEYAKRAMSVAVHNHYKRLSVSEKPDQQTSDVEIDKSNVLLIGPAGLLSDTRGRKAVVVPSTYLAAVVFFAFPFATGMPQLAVLFALLGAASALAAGTMATYTYDVIPVHARARLQTLRRLVGDGGAVLGPVLGGTIANLSSPSLAFWAFVPLQLISGLLITFLARESLPRARAQAGEVTPLP